jgi:Ca2+-transporting ATPase
LAGVDLIWLNPVFYRNVNEATPKNVRHSHSKPLLLVTSVFANVTETTTSDNGLSETTARSRLARDGANELPVSRPRGMLRLLRDVVAEPMFLLLAACGAIYMGLGDRAEALMLLGFVFVVIGIAFFQQRRSEHTLDALRDMSSPRALVVRDGRTIRIAGRELVCGDIVLLAEGDRVPADMVLLESSSLAVDESMLTGESVAVDKHALSHPDGKESSATQLYSGTLVTRGTARAQVTATGERSALGRIGKSLAGLSHDSTPIQKETRRVVKQVAIVGLVLAAGLSLAYWAIRGDWLHGLLAGLTLAMAVLPEEFPVVLALFLGLGAWRLAREQVLTRNIPSVELLGATTVLCVDKTGTLTANRMAVRVLWSESATYDSVQAGTAALQEDLHGVLEYAVLASHRRTFDPMETAIDHAGQRLLANTEHLHADWTLIEDYPLSPRIMAMSRVWQSPDRHHRTIAAKGAPEAVVDLCHLAPAHAARIAAQVDAMAGAGLRVLGVASATFSGGALPGNQHDFPFEFLGLVGLEDPIRPEVPSAITECHAAGIRVVMITGDHPATALAIARQAGLPGGGRAGLPGGGRAITGDELNALNDDQLCARLADTDVFCRVQPDEKLRLVQAFRARGDIVAMTGDGVNDAPALKAANIGVAMGARGTDVAREAADLVLLGDDFASLVTAVRYGRRVFANLRKAIVFVVAVHAPIVGLSIAPIVFGWPMLLMPAHILFLQLIIDPACTIVFEAEPLEGDAMKTTPRSAKAHLFDGILLARGLAQGGVLLAVLAALYALVRSGSGSDELARAMVFTVLVLSNLALIHANRKWGRSSWTSIGADNPQFGWVALAALTALALVLGFPAIRQLFGFALPGPLLLLAAAALAVTNLFWFEAAKSLLGKAWRPHMRE